MPYTTNNYSSNFKLATAYIPFQNYSRIYIPQEALNKGTIFPELYRPYERKRI